MKAVVVGGGVGRPGGGWPVGGRRWWVAGAGWRRRPEDNWTVRRKKRMKSKTNIMTSSKTVQGCLRDHSLRFSRFLASQGGAGAKTRVQLRRSSQPNQKQFDTPKQGGRCPLFRVATTLDIAAAKEILGPDGEDIISSEDPVMDKKKTPQGPSQLRQTKRSSIENR